MCPKYKHIPYRRKRGYKNSNFIVYLKNELKFSKIVGLKAESKRIGRHFHWAKKYLIILNSMEFWLDI